MTYNNLITTTNLLFIIGILILAAILIITVLIYKAGKKDDQNGDSTEKTETSTANAEETSEENTENQDAEETETNTANAEETSEENTENQDVKDLDGKIENLEAAVAELQRKNQDSDLQKKQEEDEKRAAMRKNDTICKSLDAQLEVRKDELHDLENSGRRTVQRELGAAGKAVEDLGKELEETKGAIATLDDSIKTRKRNVDRLTDLVDEYNGKDAAKAAEYQKALENETKQLDADNKKRDAYRYKVKGDNVNDGLEKQIEKAKAAVDNATQKVNDHEQKIAEAKKAIDEIEKKINDRVDELMKS